MSKFKILTDYSDKTKGKGFQMTFENGNTISVMFGTGNYCNNRNNLSIENGCTVSPTAEIAIWNNLDEWHNFGNDTVEGYLSSNDVAKWIDFAANNKIVPRSFD